MNDPELEELFADPAHREIVDLLKTTRPAAPPLDPHFRNYLRARLMTEGQRTLEPRAPRPWWPFTLKPQVVPPMMAQVASGFLVGRPFDCCPQRPPSPEMAPANLPTNRTNVATAE